MFHPNIYANGELCLDILQNRWSPTYDVAAILTSVQSLLNDPNPARYVVFLLAISRLEKRSLGRSRQGDYKEDGELRVGYWKGLLDY